MHCNCVSSSMLTTLKHELNGFDRFKRSYPFPSFNVQDLHTVDKGVKKHLLPEIERGDFSLLIGHFLGVDHCGHRYAPDHPAMADKLTEMNDVIRYLRLTQIRLI